MGSLLLEVDRSGGLAQGRFAPAGIVFIKFIGTHAEYDRIDPATVRRF